MTQNTAVALSELAPGERFRALGDPTQYEVLPTDPALEGTYTDRLTGDQRYLIRARFEQGGTEQVMHWPHTEMVVRVG